MCFRLSEVPAHLTVMLRDNALIRGAWYSDAAIAPRVHGLGAFHDENALLPAQTSALRLVEKT